MPKTAMTEEAMQAAEAQIPLLAGRAFKHARNQALARFGCVVEVSGGNLVETFADGSNRVIKALPASMRVVAGSKRRLKIAR